MADVAKIEEALASIEEKHGSISGLPPSIEEEVAAIRAALTEKPTREVVRSSESGEFVEKEQAKKRPKTTTTEKV